jgi:hypothetical protein
MGQPLLKMTRQEDIWACEECHQLYGRHDQWFEGDVCEECNSKIKENNNTMSVREILETNNDLRSRYASAIRDFCKERMYAKSGDKEAPAIRQIMDIFFWMGEISEKQMDWVVKYATKNRITLN